MRYKLAIILIVLTPALVFGSTSLMASGYNKHTEDHVVLSVTKIIKTSVAFNWFETYAGQNDSSGTQTSYKRKQVINASIFIIFLIVFFFLGSYFYIKYRVRYLKKRNITLEEKSRKRISKIEKQKKEIETQRDEIELQKQALIDQKQKIEKQNVKFQEQQVALEREVRNRTKDLEVAKNKAEESDKLKTAFLTNLSHEIRTPMNAIIGFSSLLSDPDITAEQRNEFVSHINHNSVSLLHMIDDIIDVSRIESNSIEINTNECSLNVVLVDIYSTYINYKSEIGKPYIDLRLNNPIKNENVKLITDSYRFRQIYANLLNNAFKYTEEGYIEFGVKKDKDKLHCFVKDTGIGIPDDKKNIIFDRFFKVEEDTSRIFRGAGIGLTLSKKLAMLLGGDLWVETEQDVGSTFYFSIPYVPRKEKSTSFDVNWSGKTIVVAEDEDENYLLLQNILNKTKINIIRAKNGQEAYNAVLANDKIDIILMDLRMPIMDGIESAGEIRNINKEVPIIAITAFAFSVEKEQILKSGFNDLVTKPIKSNVLISLIMKYLGK